MSARLVGIHVSISEKIDLAIDRALDVGCVGTFQIFTSSPRRWAAKPIDRSQAELFQEKVSRSKFLPFAHMPYMPNLASPDDKFYFESVQVLIREIKRCSELGISNLVVHYGSHMGSTIDDGHKRLISACSKAINSTSGSNVRVLLENSSGNRNSIGSKFEHVKTVLDRIGNDRRTGACFDTCHAFASGYDVRTKESAQKTIDEFDETVGLKRLYLIHVNDSKYELGQGSDRHEHIGLGRIGDKGFRSFFGLKEIRNIPLILETPIDQRRGDKENVAHVKKLLDSI
jgi:deoxyribonuclease-4